jgi:2-polyprenyl-3-methyl-5-hydroxy-6-metoxy-1,4-benzoquinol methylase
MKMKNKPPITKYVAKKRLHLILHSLQKYEKKVPKAKMKILDVGCGDGHFTRALRKHGYNVTGIDKHTPQTASWMSFQPDYQMDAMKMSFKDNSFDIAIALEVVEHVPCIPEINRVLKPEGLFFCSTPYPNTEWLRHIVVFTGLLEAQDFEHHDHIEDLRKAPMKMLQYRRMFLGTSQFAIFTKQ